MTSLWELARKLEVGDKLLWIGERAMDGAGDTAYPNTITEIKQVDNSIRIRGKGIRGGRYYFDVFESGDSDAYFVNPNLEKSTYMGPVVVARLTDSDEPIPVVRRYDDVRGEIE